LPSITRKIFAPAAVVQHQGVLITGGLGGVAAHRADHVQPGGLAGRRGAVGGGPPPRGRHQLDAVLAGLFAVVRRPGERGDGDVGFGPLRRDANHLAAAPGDRADIAGLDLIATDDLAAGLLDLLDGVGQGVAQQFAGLPQPGGVFAELEDLAAVNPFPLEHRAAVMQAVGEDVDFGVAPGNEFAVEPDDSVTVFER
jgi:hypothetical protein